MVQVIVDSRARLDPKDLAPEVLDELRKRFLYKNPKRVALEAGHVRGWWLEPIVIDTWQEEPDGRVSFPRGGMWKLREVFREHGIEFRVSDQRLKIAPATRWDPIESMELRPYQERLVLACLRTENCIVRSGTGSGKTTALLSLFARMRVPTLVLVSQVDLAEQWKERAIDELGLRTSDVGILGGGSKKLGVLTISTTRSAALAAKKDPGFVLRWGAVLIDEVHLFAAKSLFACVEKFPARYRVGASDDERRKDRLEFLLYDLFGKEPAEAVTDEELVSTGAVLDVEVLIVPTEFRADWYATGADEDKKPDFGRLVREMAEDPDRQRLVDSILEAELKDDRQVLVFAKEREHCMALGQMASRRARSGFLIGGADYRAEFRRTKQGMRKGEIAVAVGTYQACGASLDIPGIQVGIAATPCLANRTTFRQGKGRVCRAPPGKKVARFYVLWDRHVFGLRHLENASRWAPGRAFVWEGGEWQPAKKYLKAARIVARKELEDGEA